MASAPARLSVLVAVVLALGASGCTAVAYRIGIPLLYRHADLPTDQIVKDVRYWDGPDAHPDKNRLDLFRPRGTGWPVPVFVHGGGLARGDTDHHVRGAAIYGNIGACYTPPDIPDA